MKSSWKRPFHLHRWERHILFWRSVSAAHASRNGDLAVGSSSGTRDQVSQGQWEEWSRENGNSWQPHWNTEKGHILCMQMHAKRWGFLPHCKSGRSVSPEVLHRAKIIGGVRQCVLGGHAVLKAEPCFLAGVFLEIVSTYFKKREELPPWHNGRQKRKIWFYATADVS